MKCNKGFVKILIALWIVFCAIEATMLMLMTDSAFPLFAINLNNNGITSNSFVLTFTFIFPIFWCSTCSWFLKSMCLEDDWSQVMLCFGVWGLMFTITLIIVVFCIVPQTTIFALSTILVSQINASTNYLFVETMIHDINRLRTSFNKSHKPLLTILDPSRHEKKQSININININISNNSSKKSNTIHKHKNKNGNTKDEEEEEGKKKISTDRTALHIKKLVDTSYGSTKKSIKNDNTEIIDPWPLNVYKSGHNFNQFVKLLIHFTLQRGEFIPEIEFDKDRKYFKALRDVLSNDENVSFLPNHSNTRKLLKNWLNRNRNMYILYILAVVAFECIFWIGIYPSLMDHDRKLSLLETNEAVTYYYVIFTLVLFIVAMISSIGHIYFDIYLFYYESISWLDSKYHQRFGRNYHHRMGTIRDPRIRKHQIEMVDRYYVMMRYLFYVHLIKYYFAKYGFLYVEDINQVIISFIVPLNGIYDYNGDMDEIVVKPPHDYEIKEKKDDDGNNDNNNINLRNGYELCYEIFACSQDTFKKIQKIVLIDMPFGDNVGTKLVKRSGSKNYNNVKSGDENSNVAVKVSIDIHRTECLFSDRSAITTGRLNLRDFMGDIKNLCQTFVECMIK